jgi:hypothetical protein
MRARFACNRVWIRPCGAFNLFRIAIYTVFHERLLGRRRKIGAAYELFSLRALSRVLERNAAHAHAAMAAMLRHRRGKEW